MQTFPDTDVPLCLSAYMGETYTTIPSIGAVAALAAALLLLAVSVFAARCEHAFFLLTQAEAEGFSASTHPADRRIGKLLEGRERLRATLVIAKDVADVSAVVLCCYFFNDVFHFAVEAWGIVTLAATATVLLLLAGYTVPRLCPMKDKTAFLRKAVGGVGMLYSLFYPFSSVWVYFKTYADRRAARRGVRGLSVDELSQVLDMTEEAELTDEDRLLKGLIRFGGETAKEVMTSRPDVVDLEIGTPFKEVLRCVVENVYSRIPVYAGTRDNVKGILYIKDLLPHLDKGAAFKWQSLIRPAYFVPETKMIDELLRDFQQKKIHIAIVVDEFGGMSGIVTMEDVIEEIVGEIHDEYDEEDTGYTRLDEYSWTFEAKTQLVDFARVTQTDLKELQDAAGDADTLAGLMLELKGDFPELHEQLHLGRCTFELLVRDERRIVKIKVTIAPEEPDKG